MQTLNHKTSKVERRKERIPTENQRTLISDQKKHQSCQCLCTFFVSALKNESYCLVDGLKQLHLYFSF